MPKIGQVSKFPAFPHQVEDGPKPGKSDDKREASESEGDSKVEKGEKKRGKEKLEESRAEKVQKAPSEKVETARSGLETDKAEALRESRREDERARITEQTREETRARVRNDSTTQQLRMRVEAALDEDAGRARELPSDPEESVRGRRRGFTLDREGPGFGHKLSEVGASDVAGRSPADPRAPDDEGESRIDAADDVSGKTALGDDRDRDVLRTRSDADEDDAADDADSARGKRSRNDDVDVSGVVGAAIEGQGPTGQSNELEEDDDGEDIALRGRDRFLADDVLDAGASGFVTALGGALGKDRSHLDGDAPDLETAVGKTLDDDLSPIEDDDLAGLDGALGHDDDLEGSGVHRALGNDRGDDDDVEGSGIGKGRGDDDDLEDSGIHRVLGKGRGDDDDLEDSGIHRVLGKGRGDDDDLEDSGIHRVLGRDRPTSDVVDFVEDLVEGRDNNKDRDGSVVDDLKRDVTDVKDLLDEPRKKLPDDGDELGLPPFDDDGRPVRGPKGEEKKEDEEIVPVIRPRITTTTDYIRSQPEIALNGNPTYNARLRADLGSLTDTPEAREIFRALAAAWRSSHQSVSLSGKIVGPGGDYDPGPKHPMSPEKDALEARDEPIREPELLDPNQASP